MYDKSKKSWSQRLKTLGSSPHSGGDASLGTVSGMQAMQQLQLHLQHQHQQQQQQQQQQLQQQQLAQHLPQHHGHHGHHLAAYQLPPPAAAEFLPSALSRSMKYAEPWIYGTVRGIPARPSYGYHHQLHHHPHAAAIFATEGGGGDSPLRGALAVVICSCAEYLNGTKRDVKKASVCKKCKGSRLPLATMGGGTVRLPAVSSSSSGRSSRPMAATMRVVSATKKSRPSILDPQKDPYDLMRRTRLLSPEPTSASSSKDSLSKEGKSRSRETATISTTRGRTRTRAPLPPSKGISTAAPPAAAVTSAAPEPADCWLMEDNDALLRGSGLTTARASSTGSSRRSILRCNVNPYDLISIENGKQKQQSGKSAVYADDFDVADAQLHDDEQERQRSEQREKQGKRKKFYGSNVTAIAGQRISLGKEKPIDPSDSSDSYERIIIASSGSSVEPLAAAPPVVGPRRPPRNKKADEATGNSQEVPATATLPAVSPSKATPTDAENDAEDDDENDDDDGNDGSAAFTLLTVTPTMPAIKSILKRRPSTLELPPAGVILLPEGGVSPAPLLTPSGKSQFYIPTPTKATAATPTNTAAAAAAAATATSTPTSTTPGANGVTMTPTSTSTSTTSSRKKVQFMVEDKIIATTTDTPATTDDSSDASHAFVATVAAGSGSAVAADEATTTRTNYEYYNRKRNAAAAATAAVGRAAAVAAAAAAAQQETFAADVDDEHNFTTSAEPTATLAVATATALHIKPDSLHYEDVLLLPQLSGHQIFDNSDSNSSRSSEPATEMQPKLLLQAKEEYEEEDPAAACHLGSRYPHVVSVLPDGTATATTAATATATATQKTTAANRDYDDDDEHNDKDESNDKSHSSSHTNNDSNNDNDMNGHGLVVEDANEEEKEKVARQKDTARPAASQKRAAQTTQSRNPIRRAHSERHLSTAPNTVASVAPSAAARNSSSDSSFSFSSISKTTTTARCSVSSVSGPQNVILNFKDTMALRIKSNRSDSRDLFQRRPTEPPPPPPPPKGPPTETAKGLELPPQGINKSAVTTTPTLTQAQAKAETLTPIVTSTPAQPRQQQQRTVVRVAPFQQSGEGAHEVHRLKISHSEDDDMDLGVQLRRRPSTRLHLSAAEEEATPKKTSILISGDDCYSTMNLSADAAQPLYQSSVVVNSQAVSTGGVCINVSSAEEEEQQLNHLNTLRTQQMMGGTGTGLGIAIIPIRSSEINLQRSVSCISSTSSSSTSSSGSSSGRGRTLIRLDYDRERGTGAGTSTTPINTPPAISSTPATPPPQASPSDSSSPMPSPLVQHETELLKILRNPVEAVKRNLVPHVCGLRSGSASDTAGRTKKMQDAVTAIVPRSSPKEGSFIAKLLQDPMLGQVAEGLETETVAELIENSLQRLQQARQAIDMSGTKDHDDMSRLISASLQRIRVERTTKEEDRLSNRGSISSANSFASAHNYELFDFAGGNESDCYQSCSSVLTASGIIEEEPQPVDVEAEPELDAATRAKFYQLLVDATLAEIEHSTHTETEVEESEHHYESIRLNGDPIYEEINEKPPPLPLSAPPLNDAELEKKAARSIFEGASKYDILSYLVDAKERGLAREESFDYSNNPKIIEEEATDTLGELEKRVEDRDSGQSNMNSLSPPPQSFICGGGGKCGSDVERQDSGVGSETSKSSRSKYQATPTVLHLCEDCDGAVEMQVGEAGVLYAPLVCRKCGKKRVERKEIITEIVETEEKYGRDLQIILEEFCHPMLVAGLLTQEQLSAIFLNTEDLLENNQTLAERMRDALDMSLEQGDDDLLTVNIGRIFLDFTQMLHAFESYCVRQAGASLLLANLEKEKELLRIFLKVSQMENAVLRRMNLNSFLMVPVQRVTKYPLLLARLYKVTPSQIDGRELLKQAQEKIELHLNHINQEAKDVPTKLWRRISSSSPNRRASCEIDMINIKLRKMAIDVLEWNHDEVRFAMEGKLLYTQPTDSNWKKARTIKLTPVNALLVTNGKPSANYRAEKAMSDKLNFPKHTGIREASLLLVKEKCGRYTLIREPLYLDRCVVCSEADWDDYFEVQEISSKDTFIFKAEDGVRTKQWYTQMQYHAQGMGAWRKRRNALANIMINGMLARS
ncbi:serine-rich adhesin for platelets [Drosophila madeirensis]|uniref:Serine-rich adhesin for platelets n=1 Tax=Drosophila madeirensis TaxID=30013 RepID=A0AAU9FRA5_DROMD